MKWIKNNVSDLFFLVGIVFINIPVYMVDIKFGLIATGASFVILATMSKGGD